MIPIKEEPPELQENFKFYESCIFCKEPSKTWHLRTNQPVCKKCSKIHKVKEILLFTNPTKYHEQQHC